MSNYLHITLASDANYAEFVAVVIVSLLENNPQFERVTVHLLSNGIDDVTRQKLSKHVPPERGEIIFYDISNIKEMLGIEVPNTIAVSAYARLFLPSILPLGLDRVLYVDCDTVVSSEIQDFWSVEFGGHLIAGIIDPLPSNKAKRMIGLNDNSPYLNSGVLLINLKLWREENLQQQFLDYLLSKGGTVFHHDQGIINAVCHGRKKIVHPRYNVMSAFFSHPFKMMNDVNTPFYSEKEVGEAIARPAIIHFTEDFYNRPWVENSKHPLLEVYEKYHAMTEWANSPKRPDKRKFTVKFLSWEFLHLPLWCYNSTLKVISLLAR